MGGGQHPAAQSKLRTPGMSQAAGAPAERGSYLLGVAAGSAFVRHGADGDLFPETLALSIRSTAVAPSPRTSSANAAHVVDGVLPFTPARPTRFSIAYMRVGFATRVMVVGAVHLCGHHRPASGARGRSPHGTDCSAGSRWDRVSPPVPRSSDKRRIATVGVASEAHASSTRLDRIIHRSLSTASRLRGRR